MFTLTSLPRDRLGSHSSRGRHGLIMQVSARDAARTANSARFVEIEVSAHKKTAMAR